METQRHDMAWPCSHLQPPPATRPGVRCQVGIQSKARQVLFHLPGIHHWAEKECIYIYYNGKTQCLRMAAMPICKQCLPAPAKNIKWKKLMELLGQSSMKMDEGRCRGFAMQIPACNIGFIGCRKSNASLASLHHRTFPWWPNALDLQLTICGISRARFKQRDPPNSQHFSIGIHSSRQTRLEASQPQRPAAVSKVAPQVHGLQLASHPVAAVF